MLFFIDALQDTLHFLTELALFAGVENGLLKILLKIVGVGYLTEFCAGILNDFGSNTIADKVVLGGKITILLLSIPIVEGLFNLIRGFLQFL